MFVSIGGDLILTPKEKYLVLKVAIMTGLVVSLMIVNTFIDFEKMKKFEMSYGDRRGAYSGEVTEEGIPNGSGVLELKNKEKVTYIYRGDFVDGHFDGKGEIVWYYEDEVKYEVGTYKNDEIASIKVEEETADLFWNAEEYIYHCIEFTGVVEGEPEDIEDFAAFNVMWDIENNDDALTVNIYDHDFEVEPGDYVRVMGIVERCYTELNDAGEEKTVPVIAAYEYDVISYEEAISPELFEKDPDKKYLRPVWYTK